MENIFISKISCACDKRTMFMCWIQSLINPLSTGRMLSSYHSRAGATQLGIFPRICPGCITCRQRTAFLSRSKTDLPVAVICVLYIWQNREQVGRRYWYWSRQSWSTRQLACSSTCTSNPRRSCKLQLGTMKIGKRYSLGQSQKVAAHAVEWRRVL